MFSDDEDEYKKMHRKHNIQAVHHKRCRMYVMMCAIQGKLHHFKEGVTRRNLSGGAEASPAPSPGSCGSHRSGRFNIDKQFSSQKYERKYKKVAQNSIFKILLIHPSNCPSLNVHLIHDDSIGSRNVTVVFIIRGLYFHLVRFESFGIRQFCKKDLYD